MTKKDKILKIFNEQEWHRDAKTLCYEHFQSVGLDPNIEYGEKYCDVIYAQQIFRKMGYRTGVGMALHIYRNTKNYSKK